MKAQSSTAASMNRSLSNNQLSLGTKNPFTSDSHLAKHKRRRRNSMEHESPPQPERAPPIPISELDSADFVARVVREVAEHACGKHGKSSLMEVNMLDALASFEEIMMQRYPNMSKEISARVYKRLIANLNLNTINSKKSSTGKQQPLDIFKELTSLNSTINQDLQFDFQGSFGDAYKLKSHLMSREVPQQQSLLMTGSMQSEDLRPQRLTNSKDRIVFPQINLMMSRQASTQNNTPHHQQTQQKSSIMDRLAHMESIQSGSSTSKKIQLPKLSFNDLIQGQQQQRNQTQRDEIILINDHNDEELQNSDLSVFRSGNNGNLRNYYNQKLQLGSYDQQTTSRSTDKVAMPEIMRFPKVQLIRDSDQNTVDSQLMSGQRQHMMSEDSEIINYYPVRAIPQPISKSVERSHSGGRKQLPKPVRKAKSKDNSMIDSQDAQLALQFRQKHLVLKAWKSFLIQKMRSIHLTHATKLSNAYYTRKLLFKYLQYWRFYIKRVLPEERYKYVAENHYIRRLMLKSILVLRKRAFERTRLKKKLIYGSKKFGFRHLVRYFNLFKVGIAQSQIQQLKIQQAHMEHAKTLKHLTLKAFALYSIASKRRKEMNKNQQFFRFISLARRALLGFKLNVGQQKQKITLNHQASTHCKGHYELLLLQRSLYILREFATHNKYQRISQGYRDRNLYVKYFKLLKFYTILRKCARNQSQYVEQFQRHRMMIRVMQVFKDEVMMSKQSEEIVRTYIERAKKRRILIRGFKNHAVSNAIGYPPTHGGFLRCCEIWLRATFGDLMENVWKEFPKQKIAQASGHDNFLLNYLGLSRVPRYRQFFYIANLLLRKHVMSKCIQQLRRNAIKVRNYRNQKRIQVLALCFNFIEKQTQKLMLIRNLMAKKKFTRDRNSLQKVFFGFRYNLSLQRSFYQILKLRKNNLMYTTLKTWNFQYKTAVKHQQQDEASLQIYRQRFLTKYLSLWLKELHGSLKEKHLETIRKTYQKTCPQRRKFFYQWINSYRKHKYLEEQEKQINGHQVNIRLYQVFSALKSFTSVQLLKKRKIQGAIQENRYWIARNCLQNWVQAVAIEKSKRNLLKSMAEDRSYKMITQCFGYLRVYAQYRRDKRISDFVMTKAVEQVSKKKFVQIWRNQLRVNIGLKMFEAWYKQVSVGLAMRKIQEVKAYQDICISQMRIKSKIYYPVAICFKQLQRYLNHLKTTNSKGKQLTQSHLIFQKRMSLKHWSQLTTKTRSLYQQFAFTLIHLKNLYFQRPAFQALKRQMQLGLLSRFYSVKSKTQVKQRVFNSLKLLALNSQRLLTISDYLKVQTRTNILSVMLQKWKQRLASCIQIQRVDELYQNKIIRKVIEELIKYSRQQKAQKKFIQQKANQIQDKINKKHGFLRFRDICSLRQQQKAKHLQAQEFNLHKMFKASMQAWVSYFKSHQDLIKKQVFVQRNRNQHLKHRYLQKWLKRAKPALQRLKGAQFILKIKQKKQMRPKFVKWVQEMIFFRSLEQRELDFTARYMNPKSKLTALKYLKQYSHRQILNRERNHDIRKYSIRKVQYRTLQKFKQWILISQRQKYINAVCISQYLRSLKKYAFILFRKTCVQSQAIRFAEGSLKHYQLHSQGTDAIRRLRNFKNQSKQYKVLNSFSMDFLKQNLCNKVITALQYHARSKFEVRKMYYHARIVHNQRIMAKTFALLGLYSTHKAQLKLKREALSQIIERIDSQNLVKQVFQAFAENISMSKSENIKCQDDLRRRKLRRLFMALQTNYSSKISLREAFNQVQEQKQTKQITYYYLKWYQTYVQESKVKQSVSKKRIHTLQIIFACLKSRLRILKSVMKMRSRAINSLLHLAYGAFLSNLTRKRTLAMKDTQAQLHYMRSICRKGVTGLKKAVHVKKIIAEHLGLKKARSMQAVIEALRRVRQRERVADWILSTKLIKRREKAMRGWLQVYKYRQARKQKLSDAASRIHVGNLKEAFLLWKKTAFFQKICHLLYDSQSYSQVEAVQMKRIVLREWIRYHNHSKNKEYYRDCIQLNHRQRLLTFVTKTWKQKCRAQILAGRLQSLVNRQMDQVILKMSGFSEKQAKIDTIGDSIQTKRESQVKKDFLQIWQIARIEHAKNRIVSMKYREGLLKKAFNQLETYRLEKMSTKFQMIQIIEHFGERPPGILLAFSKTFLHLNYEYSNSTICSTALAKYVIEKWKNLRPQIRESNESNSKAARFYLFNLYKKGLQAMVEGINILSHKRSLKLSCFEFHNMSVMKRVMQAFMMNKCTMQKKRQLQNLQLQIESIRNYNERLSYFSKWSKSYHKLSGVRSFERELQVKYNYERLFQVWQALKNHAIKSLSKSVRHESAVQEIHLIIKRRYLHKMIQIFNHRRAMQSQSDKFNEIADDYYQRRLQQRVFNWLREITYMQVNRNKHSILAKIMLQWRCFVKEKKLLNKYLTECNYSQKQYRSQSGKSGRNNQLAHRSQVENVTPTNFKHQRSAAQLTYSLAQPQLKKSQRALVDIDHLNNFSRRSSNDNQKLFTPTLGGNNQMSFKNLQRSSGGNQSDENFNSINSPHSESMSPPMVRSRDNSQVVHHNQRYSGSNNGPQQMMMQPNQYYSNF